MKIAIVGAGLPVLPPGITQSGNMKYFKHRVCWRQLDSRNRVGLVGGKVLPWFASDRHMLGLIGNSVGWISALSRPLTVMYHNGNSTHLIPLSIRIIPGLVSV
jgi:hypothetical protein